MYILIKNYKVIEFIDKHVLLPDNCVVDTENDKPETPHPSPETPKEIYKIKEVPENEKNNVSTIKLILPNGKSELKRFFNDSKIGEIFEYVKIIYPNNENKEIDIIQRYPSKSLLKLKEKTIKEENIENSALCVLIK